MSRPTRILCATLIAFGGVISTSAARTADHLRFVVLGHLRGDHNGELLSNLREVVECVRREDPDLVFLCGDLIWGNVDQEGPNDPAQIRADWEQLDAALSAVGAPIHRVPGNHDVNDLVTRDVWRERYGVVPRTISLGSSRFVLLNSSWSPQDGDTRKHPQDKIRGVPLDAAQIAFLHSELEHFAGVEHVFLFMHHLLWWENNAPWWKKVAPEFEGHPVRAVFSGDYGPMKFAHLERAGVHYLQTSIENRVSLDMQRGNEASRMLSSQFDNYLVVDVDGADVRYSVRTVGAMTTGKFSPDHYRDVHEYDKDTYGRKLMKRWSTPERLIRGLAEISALAFAIGVLTLLSVFLFRRWLSGHKA